MGGVYTGKYKNMNLSAYNTQGLQKTLENLEKSGLVTQDQKDYTTSIKAELAKRGISTGLDPETIIFGLLALGLFVWFYSRKK